MRFPSTTSTSSGHTLGPRDSQPTRAGVLERYGSSFRIGLTAFVKAFQWDTADETLRLAIVAAGIALLVIVIGATLVRRRRARRPLGRPSKKSASRRRSRAPEDPPATTGDAVEQLVQLLSNEAAVRGRGDVEATAGEEAQKQATSDELDAEVLRRKGAVDAEILDAKAKREAAVLKEKLATGQEQRQEAGRREQARRPAGRLLACEVRWVPTEKASKFIAVELGADGAESTIAASQPFDWRKRVPPPESPVAAAALGGLIDRLLSEGWVATGRGEEWFASKFLLPTNVTRRPSP